jgi:hypothetical protein
MPNRGVQRPAASAPRASADAPAAVARRAPGANATPKPSPHANGPAPSAPNKRRCVGPAPSSSPICVGGISSAIAVRPAVDAVPHWPDPTKPLDVTWLCRVHRENERDRLAEEAAATKKVVAWKTLGERFAAEWPQLAPDLQARLRAEVERSSAFRIVRANPESLLYRQQLVAAFGRYCASLEPVSSG